MPVALQKTAKYLPPMARQEAERLQGEAEAALAEGTRLINIPTEKGLMARW